MSESTQSIDSSSKAVKRNCKKIFDLLESVKVTKGSCNMISMNPPGRYNINEETLEKLHNYYSKVYNKIPLNLAEIPQEISYFKLDIDLDSKKKPKKRLYDKKNILKVSDIVRESAEKYLNLNNDDKVCYVFEKKSYDEKDDTYRDGYHLAYPFIIHNSKVRNAIFTDVYTTLEKEKVFDKYETKLNKILDRNASIGKTPWLMLGSAKPNCSPYNISMILNHRNKKMSIGDAKDNLELLSLLNNELTLTNSSELKSNVSMEKIDKKYDEISSKLQTMINLPSTNKDAEVARILIKMLSTERSENYDSWIKVGYCLYNIDRTLLNEWIDFSKKSKAKFKKGECEKLWKKMKSGQNLLTIRSLHLWAREDNYLEYSMFKSKEYNSLFKLSMTGDHQNVANAIFSKYQTDFICASIKHKVWYQYNYSTHRWEKREQGHSLVTKITDEFVNEYLQMSTDLYKKAMEAESHHKMDIMKEVEKIQLLVNRLNNEAFLSTLMNALGRRFYIEKFSEKLDENYDLIGFNNGVYDLKEKRFRHGRPEDFITMTTGLDYQPLDKNSEEYKSIMKLFEEIHPDKATREYVLTLLSTWVAGHHKEETLHLFTGCGSNGKSVTFELLKYAFGDYFMSVPITLLTRKRGGTENASPMLAQIKGKRLGVLQEPEEGEKLHVGLMKELTGNDEISARPMYEDPITFKPQIKFAIPCNNLPEVPARDKGTWRRLRVIDHVMEFVKHPDKKNKFQKKIDYTLKEKLEGFATQLMSFLIDRYLNVYCKEGLDVPDSVTYATNMYNQENNCIKQFVDNKIQITGNKTDKISCSTLWHEFKNYMKEDHESIKRPTRKELESFCSKELGKIVKGGFMGVVFSVEDEIDDKELAV